ncbi:methionine synthase reductase-like, partial [Pollicipes pollicipes]|uniref:methionine synthase reductase-like n=1 Tax=Pollicipes pollicipes TaxID=41117 RepID=UPI001884AC95
AGDTVGLLCPNAADEVAAALDLLGAESRADRPCRLSLLPGTTKKAARVPPHLPEHASLRHLLTHCVDLRAVPKKPLLQALVGHAADQRERRRLRELSSRQGGGEYLELVRGAGLGALQLLQAFPSCRPPPELLLEQLPPLAPRPYSAASSALLRPGRLRLVFSVVAAPRRGLCTGWLDARLPERDDAPLVMVAAGTGLAPLAGFLEERRARGQRAPAWLVFGCRHPELDFLLRDELEAALRDGFLSRLDTVFSRTGDRQRYVQHVLAEEQARLARWLVDDGAVMYVCGDAKGMAVAVLDEVVQAVAKAKEVPVSEAKKQVQQMQKDGQYRLDVWS